MKPRSSSEIAKFAFCPLSHHYTYDLNLTPKQQESLHHLLYGSAGHEALRVLHTERDLDKAKAALQENYPSQLDLNDNAKTVANGLIMLDGYVKVYNYDRSWEILSCEEMDTTEDDHVVKLDLVVRDIRTGSIYGVDHKFTGKQLDSSYFSRYEPNSQITHYYRHVKEKHGRCDGFIINAISMKWLNEKDKAGRWNGKYFDKDDPDRLTYSQREVRYVKYYKREMVACWGLKLEYERYILNRTSQQVAQEIQSRDYWLSRIEDAQEKGVWGLNTSNCFLCEFQPACAAGWDWENDSQLILNHYRQVCRKFTGEFHCNQDLGHEGKCRLVIEETPEPEFVVDM